MSIGEKSNNRASVEGCPQLTPCEFEIMEILWQRGSATVREVHAALKPARGLAYTTVMTVMDKLHRKGALGQKRQGRAFVYTVQVSQAQALHQQVSHVIRHYFQGSTQKFLSYLHQEFGGDDVQVRKPAFEPAPADQLDELTPADLDAALL
jgi:predicted transcriptional regulator